MERKYYEEKTDLDIIIIIILIITITMEERVFLYVRYKRNFLR